MGDVHRYDVIVIGLGAMGSAALDHLARRGADVLGLERFGIPHEQGSSGGDTRLIRKAYFEHPDYVPLLQRAYTNWDDLEARSGERVLFRTGAVYIGRGESDLITGSCESARLYNLVCDKLSSETVARRWEPMRVPEGYEALHEPEGGFVLSAKSIRLHCESALRHGARVQCGEAVLSWNETKDGVEVVANTGTYHAARLIVAVGSWASSLLPRVKTPLDVTRQALFWVWPKNIDEFALNTFPCWAAQIDGYEGTFYGFPVLPAGMGGQLGLKIAHHVKGLPTQPGNVAPIEVSEFAPIREALKPVFACDLGPVVATKACMYTSTVDHNFIVDRYPQSDRVAIACGFSGHGFKFASVIGEALADLALEGRTALPIGFLGLERFNTR